MGKWLSDIANEVESVVVYFKCGINLLMISNKYIYILEDSDFFAHESICLR